MRFKWNPAEDNQAKQFTIRVVGLDSIVLQRDEPFSFQSQEHYRPYKERFEALVNEGELKLLGREFAQAGEEQEAAAPVAEPSLEEPAQQGSDEQAAPAQAEDPVAAILAETEAEMAKDLESMTVDQLKLLCDAKKIEYNKKAKKSDLIALLSPGG